MSGGRGLRKLLREIAGNLPRSRSASGDAVEGGEVVFHHRVEGELLLGGLAGLLGDLFEQAGGLNQGGNLLGQVGSGVDLGQKTADAVFDDFGGSTGCMGQGGHAAGHGLEEGVGESLMRGGHGEEGHGLIKRRGFGLMTLQVDA